MRKIKFLSVALLSSMFVLTSCDKNNSLGPNGISNEIYSEFSKLYPNAKDVEWKSDGTYAIASFELNGNRAGSSADNTAWFELASSKFVMDEHDMPYSQLSPQVKSSFEQTKYYGATWKHDDDVDVLKRLDRSADSYYLYVIEVENKQTDEEYDLYFDETGLLVKEVPNAFGENDFTDLLPSKPIGSVEAWVQDKYPGARIIDLNNEDGGIEVEFIYKNLKHEALLTMSYEWVYTKTDHNWDASVLPVNALTFITSKHGDINRQNYRDLDIEKYDCADASKNFFNVEVEDYRDREFEYNFDLNGVEISKPDFSDDLGSEGGLAVDADIQKVLDEKYPGAIVLERDYDDGLLELEIRHNGIEKDVYFDRNNKWVRTNYDMPMLKLDASVSRSINSYISTNHNGFVIEDGEVEVLEDLQGLKYIVEIENGKDVEYKLFFEADGTHLRTIKD